MQTPNKFSSSSSKFIHFKDELLSTYSPKSEPNINHYSVLNMISTNSIEIDSSHLTSPIRKGSLLVQKSLSNNSDDSLVEDRFIPSRRLIQEFAMNEKETNDENNLEEDPQTMTVAQIYSEEILGKNNSKSEIPNENDIYSFKNKNILKFRLNNSTNNKLAIIPNSSISELNNNYAKNRRINKVPCKVLDAPALSDDFYLNLIDWSPRNQLAVGLGNCIYLWNAETSKVTRLCEVQNDSISSVCWSGNGPHLAIGCSKGEVLLWDVEEQKQVRRLEGHEIRVGSMAWGKNFLSTGSRDKTILQRDIRASQNVVQKLTDHNQEICGLKWSKDDQYLASGGNDNKVMVWNLAGQAINKFSDHKAAVKAMAWSPHQHGLLATGGGTADRMIKMRNVFTGEIFCEQDTGSQICNLEFSRSLHEIVSTHGYSQNEINVWSYPNMKKVATLKGHTFRVLYLALSPDGSTIVTGAGDETLRFWEIFPSISAKVTHNKSELEVGISCR